MHKEQRKENLICCKLLRREHVSKFRSNRSVLDTPPRWHASRPNLFVISELDGDERVLRSFNLVSSGFRSQPKVPFCFLAFTEQNLWKEASISEQINWERRQAVNHEKEKRPTSCRRKQDVEKVRKRKEKNREETGS